MKKIYTGIDFGSNSIKIIVCEVVNNKFHVLATSNTRCKGIQNGIITDIELVKPYLLKAKKNVEEMLGISLSQAIVTVSSYDTSFNMVEGSVAIEAENKVVDSNDINNVLKEAIIGKVDDDKELITISPISFQVDDKEPVKDPKGLIGEILKMRAIITTIPKRNFKVVVGLLKECDIQAIDVSFGAIGDYYQVKNNDIDNKVAAIINLGYSKVEVSIFNKGIMIKNEIIEMGSSIIDKDLSEIYQIKKGTAKRLKENFAVSNTRYSDVSNVIELTNKDGDEFIVNQLEVSEIVESRIVEMLKLAKKQINLLTNREISYIIITGGISELAGFEYVVENIFDRRASTLNIKEMGIRSNVYSSCYGIIKYFHHKLNLRGQSYSMISSSDEKKLISNKDKVASNDNIISKIFGYFTSEQ